VLFSLFDSHYSLSPLQRSDVNLSVLKILRVIQSDSEYISNLRSDFPTLEQLCTNYLSSASVHHLSKSVVSDILSLKYPNASLHSYFYSLHAVPNDQSLVIAYVFGDMLSANSFSWSSFLGNVTPSNKYHSLHRYLVSRYITKPKPFVDHPYYPSQQSVQALSGQCLPLSFSPYFTISFGHITEVLAACAFYNFNTSAIERPSIIYDPRFAVNSAIIDLLVQSRLLVPVHLDSIPFNKEFFTLLDLSYEFQTLASLRLLSTTYNIANDTLQNSNGACFNDQVIGRSLCQTILASLSNSKISSRPICHKPFPCMIHVRTQQYKFQPHMHYRCSSLSILVKALTTLGVAYKLYPSAADPLPCKNSSGTSSQQWTNTSGEYGQFISLISSESFIGTNSGPGHLAPVLGIPTLLLNATSLGACPIFHRNCLLSLKRIICVDPSDYKFSLNHFADYLFSDWNVILTMTNTRVRQLSSIEIADELDCFSRFRETPPNGQWPFTLKKLLDYFGCHKSRIGDVFLTQNTYLHLAAVFSLFSSP